MATGESRTRWNGQLHESALSKQAGNNFDIVITYPGKVSTASILNIPPAEVRQVWVGGGFDILPQNRLYYGDNLPLLAHLLYDNDVRGKVELIYIDPPFATNSVFKSRSQDNAYHDLMVGAHYLEFIRQRLVLLRELLSPTGSIYVHLDENMVFHVKTIMDEIFGKSNFRNFITRRKCNPKNYTRNTYGNVSDYILFYTKSDEYTWKRAYETWTEERQVKEYPCIDEATGRRYKKVPVHAPGVRNGETGQPWRGKMPPPGKHWQYKPSTLDEMDARGEIYWSPTGNPRRKVFLDQSEGVPVQDIWLDVKDAHNQNIKITGYPTEKPFELLKRIIEASSNPGDLVLDCFAGSGTTLGVAQHLKRKWIGIDNSLEAINATLKRFCLGLEPMGDYVENKTTKKKSKHPEVTSKDFVLYTSDQDQSGLTDLVSSYLYR